MGNVIEKVKKILNKDITSFLVKYKLPLAVMLVAVLLTCVGFIFTYAFYEAVDTTPIIGATTGKIGDLEVRVMAEERDTNGNGLGKYALYPYIPRAGYRYNAEKSKCSNGSTFTYDEENYEVNITASGKDVCYIYFDSTAGLDLTLNVYAENVNSDGIGTGEYTKLETTALPTIGYELARSSCQNGSTVTYSAAENLFTVEADGKDVCDVYMDAMDVDIAVKIFLQAKKGSNEYYESNNIPSNNFYVLNTDPEKSACTGTSTLSVVNQRVVVSATSRTNCVAYLDIGTGPIIESMEATVFETNVTINLTNSNVGLTPNKYYYSSDNGKTYVEATTASRTFENLAPLTNYTFKAYSKDANGNTSAVVTVKATTGENYVFNGLYPYSSSVQTWTVEREGYYKLETWGAQGGTHTSTYQGGKGGYSTGIVHLNAGDKLYIHTGGQPTAFNSSVTSNNTNAGGANGGGTGRTFSYSGTTTYGMGGGGGTDIRINSDNLYARVIVAGGGSGATNASAGKAGGGTTSQAYSATYQATQTTAGTGGSFGTGGNAGGSYNYKYGSSGGGGGWYGGGAGTGQSDSDTNYRLYNGGGSGYVYTSSTAASYPSGCLLNANYYLTSAATKAGTSTFKNPSGANETGHSGNGYAKVTYVGKTKPAESGETSTAGGIG